MHTYPLQMHLLYKDPKGTSIDSSIAVPNTNVAGSKGHGYECGKNFASIEAMLAHTNQQIMELRSENSMLKVHFYGII